MTASHRFLLCLSLSAMLMIAASPLLGAQESMMLRRNNAPAGAAAINRGYFNNDGILDLVTTNGGSTDSISVWLGRADGTFAPPINTNTAGGGVDVAVGDFNNDGKLDIAIVPGGFGSSFQVLLGNGDGTFQPPITVLTRGPVISITNSDFNNDGKMDLAVGENGSQNFVEIFAGDGTGHFFSVNLIAPPDGSGIGKVRVGDFNRDGKVDIAVLQNNAITALFGNGDFTFDAVLLNHYAQTNDMNTGDMNQDSFTDILVSFTSDTSTLAGGVDEYLGTPNRSLNFQQLIAPNSAFESPRQMIAADVNGDGINDLAALDNDGTFADGLYVWLGNANGTLQQTPTRFVYTTDRDKTALVAGDFNRDGKIDFAAGLIFNGLMEVLLNATPRAACQKNTANGSITVCQPQEATFSNSPLHIIAEGNDSKGVNDIDVFIDNVKKGSFASSSINQFFNLSNGDHFVVVKGFDPTGASFRSDRHVTIFSGAPGETCPSSSSTALSVNICLPAQNATLSSPVQIFANSYSPRPLTAIQVYIDNQLEFNDATATEVNKLFSMAPGMHFIVVKAFDATGNSVSESRTIDVK